MSTSDVAWESDENHVVFIFPAAEKKKTTEIPPAPPGLSPPARAAAAAAARIPERPRPQWPVVAR